MMNHIFPLVCVVGLLSGCAGAMPFGKPPLSNPTSGAGLAPAPAPQMTALPPPVGAQSAAALDTTTEAQKAAALAAPEPAAAAALGVVAVALGNVTEPGLWLRAPLVKTAGKGHVKLSGGPSIEVDLLPGEGGAQLSLAAYRALGLGLTDLPEVTVFAK